MKRTILKTPDEVTQWFSEAPEVLAFDWETTGLNYLMMEPVGVSFCDGKRSCYIDLWENEDDTSICDILSSAIQRGLFMGHNLKFDLKCCTKFLGTRPVSMFCTYIASYLLDENRPSHSLDNLASSLFGMRKTGKWEEFSDYHSEEFYEYAMVDSELCYRLYELFQPQLKEQELETVFKIEMDFIPVAAEMEMNGVYVDQNELSQLQARVEAKLLECEEKMLAMVGLEPDIQTGLFGQQFRKLPINFRSSKQLAWCFNKLGLPLKEKTDTGEWSISKTTLDRLEGEPFVDELSEYKRLQKLYTSYILPAWEMIDADGRIRPNINIVKTGRTSMSNPNLQQLPNVKDKSINYRKIFGTRGHLIGADYSGQELRILGEITQDERIIDAFHNDADLHLLTASYVFDLGLKVGDCVTTLASYKETCQRYKTQRYRAKNGANFPIVYGSSAGGIAWRQGVSKNEAQKWVDGFFKAYPRVKTEMGTIPNELSTQGMVSTLMGRRRRFPDYKILPQFARHKQPSKDRCVRQAFNFKIQGFAADQAKIAGRKIYDMLKANPQWEARIILLVHDEWVVEVLNDYYVNEVKSCIIDCMENAVCLSVPFKVDCKVGGNYSEIK